MNWRSDIRIIPEEIVANGDWAFARSSVTGTATPLAGGSSIPVDVKQIAIYRLQADGQWRIARLITNSNGS
jgi:ketosteroid isomerase-like protein